MPYGLLQAGQQTKRNAMSSINSLAQAEQQREIANEQMAVQKKQSTISNVGTGAAIGASVGGPWGAVIGGAIGLVGSLF